nr:hypothetical protein [Micromonospora provocatoris]
MSSERLAALLDEYAELERRLADPAIHADQGTARRVAVGTPNWSRCTRRPASWSRPGPT